MESRYVSTLYAIRMSDKGELFYRLYVTEDETYSLYYQKDYDSEPVLLFNTKEYDKKNDGAYYIDYINLLGMENISPFLLQREVV